MYGYNKLPIPLCYNSIYYWNWLQLILVYGDISLAVRNQYLLYLVSTVWLILYAVKPVKTLSIEWHYSLYAVIHSLMIPVLAIGNSFYSFEYFNLCIFSILSYSEYEIMLKQSLVVRPESEHQQSDNSWFSLYNMTKTILSHACTFIIGATL